MRRIARAAALVPLVALALAVPPVVADSGNKYPVEVIERDCDEQGGTIIYNGPLKLWPPNHKLVPIFIDAIADNPNDQVNLMSGGAHDQGEGDDEAPGSGNTQTDVDPPADEDSGTGSARTEHGVRAERAGTIQDGRTYEIVAEATFGASGECRQVFEITVPHDMRGGADWK